MTNDAHAEDRLWVPLLTHYREESDRLIVDVERMVRHLRAIQPAVRQFMLAGSTGDGWELTWEQEGAYCTAATAGCFLAGGRDAVRRAAAHD